MMNLPNYQLSPPTINSSSSLKSYHNFTQNPTMAAYIKLFYIIFLSHMLIHINICNGARLLNYLTHPESSAENDDPTLKPASEPIPEPEDDPLFSASTPEPSPSPASEPTVEPASEPIPEPELLPYSSPFFYDKVVTPRAIPTPGLVQPKIAFGGVEVALGLP